MRIATVLDLPKIIMILREAYTDEQLEGIEFSLSVKLKAPGNVTLVDHEISKVIFIEALGSDKCQFHIYAKAAERGKRTVRFAKKARDFILKHSRYNVFMTFIPSDLESAKVFAKILKLKRIAKIPNDSGVIEELWMTTRKQWESVTKTGGK